jgi:uncharacterized protein GlcG (DUF336 family)
MLNHALKSLLVCAALALATDVPAQQPSQQPGPPPAPPFGTPITVEQAQKAVDAAAAEAKKINVNMAIAIVEPSGDLVYFRKMNGAPYSAIVLSQGKAVTSARYRRPTKFFNDQIEGGHAFFLTFPGIIAAPGGLPLVVDGKLIGAIGISGGNGDQDTQVAMAAIGAMK